MEAGERAEFRHRERLVLPEQLHRVHHPIIVDIAAEILSGVVVNILLYFDNFYFMCPVYLIYL